MAQLTSKWMVEQFKGNFFSNDVVNASPPCIAEDPETIFNEFFPAGTWMILERRSYRDDTMRFYRISCQPLSSMWIETWRAIRIRDLDAKGDGS